MAKWHTMLCTGVFLTLTSQSIAEEARLVGIALQFQTQDIDWEYTNNTTRQTQLDTITLSWYEKLGARINGGLHLSTVDGSQPDNSVPAARIQGGNSLGISFRYIPIDYPSWGLNIDALYEYADTIGQVDSQKSQWQWHHLQGGAELYIKISDVRFSAGAMLNTVKGKESLTGSITQINRFEHSRTSGAKLGLDIELDHTGRIGIQIEGGYARGGRLTFERWF